MSKAIGRGRPKLALRDDIERHSIAYFIARSLYTYAPRPTPLAKLIKLIMQANHGKVDTKETRDRVAGEILAGRDFRIDMRRSKGENCATEAKWQNRDTANALGDDFHKEVKRILKRLPAPSDSEDASSDEKDARWLALMVQAWRLVVGIYTYQGNAFAAAAVLAAEAGEHSFFCDRMAPLFIHLESAGFHRPI